MIISLKRHRLHTVFLLLALAACANDSSPEASAAPRVPVPASLPSVAATPVIVPYPPSPAVVAAQPQDFPAWLAGFEQEARMKGIAQPVLDNAFAGMTGPSDEILAHDKTQPEKTRTFAQYMDGFLKPGKIEAAREQWRSHAELLGQVQQTYGVPIPVLLALWHTESRFGRHQGSYSITQALATMAYDGRRSAFFRAQLLDALTILQQENMDARELIGSWAGAMGQVQFMPSSYLAYAVDFDGDGRKDIWGDDADALASMANYLHSKGWDENLAWGFAVIVPNGPQSAEWLRTKERYTADQWNSLGVRNKDGSTLHMRDQYNHPLRLVMPDSDPANAYLVTSNYDVIMDWNRSVYFATGVCLFADAIARP